MGVNFSVLKIRGVAAEGCGAGDRLVFYVGKKKLRYILSDDADPEQMNRMFHGVEKFPLPKKKYKPSDWRLEQQKKELLPVMKGIKTVLLLAALGSCMGLVFHHPAWSIPGIVVSVVCGILELMYPQYFTLLDFGKGESSKHAIGLAFPAALPLMVQTLYVNARYDFLTMEIWIWSAGMAVAICVVFGLLVREFSDRTGDLLALLLLLGLFLSGPIGMVNGLTDWQRPVVYPVIVEDLYISSGKTTTYHCTVTLQGGEDFVIQITEDEYNDLAVGQQITIAHHSGGLGMEYISYEE